VASKLAGGLPPEFVALPLTFSARTSANMVQDIVGEGAPPRRGAVGLLP
jgi:hypothetical protein